MKKEYQERLVTGVIVIVAVSASCFLSCGESAEYTQWVVEEILAFLFNY
jgi:hypothetical protein